MHLTAGRQAGQAQRTWGGGRPLGRWRRVPSHLPCTRDPLCHREFILSLHSGSRSRRFASVSGGWCCTKHHCSLPTSDSWPVGWPERGGWDMGGTRSLVSAGQGQGQAQKSHAPTLPQLSPHPCPLPDSRGRCSHRHCKRALGVRCVLCQSLVSSCSSLP